MQPPKAKTRLGRSTYEYLSHGTHFPSTDDLDKILNLNTAIGQSSGKPATRVALTGWLNYEQGLIQRPSNPLAAATNFGKTLHNFDALLTNPSLLRSPLEQYRYKIARSLIAILKHQSHSALSHDNLQAAAAHAVSGLMSGLQKSEDIRLNNKLGLLAEVAFAGIALLPSTRPFLPTPATLRQEQPIYKNAHKTAVDLNFIPPISIYGGLVHDYVRPAQIKLTDQAAYRYEYHPGVTILAADKLLGLSALEDFDNYTRHLGNFALQGQTSGYLEAAHANFVAAIE